MTTQNDEKDFNIFCENCDNILDITKATAKIDKLESETPKSLSTESDKNFDYEKFLKKIENGEKVTDQELMSVDLKELGKHDYYKKMAKKGDVKKQIADMIEDLGNSDTNTQAYMICKSCGTNKQIPKKYRIISRNPEGVASLHDDVNESNYRIKVFMRTIPRTRNFNCLNKSCPSQKSEIQPEAIFFRKHANTFETIYVCVHCLTVKPN